MRLPAARTSSPAGERLLAPGLILISAFSVQFGAAFAVRLFSLTSPTTTAWIRNTVGALALLGLLLAQRRSLRRVSLRPAVMLGVVLGTMNATFYEGIQRLPLGDAVAVEFAGPIAVAAFAGHRRRDLVWVALAAAGVLALSRPGAQHLDYAGLGFIAVAAGCWSAYILLGRSIATGGRRAASLVIAMLISSAWLVIPALVRSAPTLLDLRVLGLGAAIGILSSAIPYSLELRALERVPPSVFGVLLSLEPVVAALMGFLVLGQTVSALEAAGFALVVTASAGVTLTHPGEPVASADLPAPTA